MLIKACIPPFHRRAGTAPPRLNSTAGLALLPLLSSCGGDHWDNCWDCNRPPQQGSAGVVSADFNHDGFADVARLMPPSR